MNTGVQLLLSTSLLYLGVDVLLVWGLNLQFGVSGVLNFSFVMFQALGAYTVAVLTLGPDKQFGGFQSYIIGSRLPFWLAVLIAFVLGAVLSIPVGLVALRRLRADYQAVALLVVSVIATMVVTNDTGLFNGSAGLALIPHPFQSYFHLSLIAWQWWYAGLVAIVCVVVYFLIVRRVTASPLGRSLRSVRDNEHAAAALGKPVLRLRLLSLALGSAIASLSGALIAPFIGSWAPSGWTYPETFVLVGAIIIGGRGNDFGAMVGALIFPVLIFEGGTFLPQFGRIGLVSALQWILTGAILLLFLYFRPQGLFPERRRVFRDAVKSLDE
jgi:branched-chain amino acid transport system permease protein